ncbi:YheC/YheD family protein [Bacillus pinisoli]|uniref:YheC/YheD family endospore coat-associated protein n=1 Tax=Bacillus pinisoli TaxID=2901866 RepID=UPI001FF40E54|nr:YheC/YheD family protein [Bacillus pinisoli]
MKQYLQDYKWTTDSPLPVTWGKKAEVVLHSPSLTTHSLSITQTEKIQPLVGIITSNHKTRGFAGNAAAFQRIQLALQQTGGLSYVFTPSEWRHDEVTGYVYDFRQNKWVEGHFPIPDLVYNRIPFRAQEQFDDVQYVKEYCQLQNIPYFNDSFLRKEQVFQWLSQNPALLPHLPETRILSKLEDFQYMVKKYEQIYLKPSKGKKGKGIYVINKNERQLWNVKTVQDSHLNLSMDTLLDDWVLPTITKNYIIQQAISPLKWNGARFDYRVLVHRKNQEEFIVSGIGVRQSQLQDVTTHVPTGGKIISFHDLPYQKDKEVITWLANEVGRSLAQHLHIGEFSIDIGKCKKGNLYVFEVNSKPMVFDEDDIRRNGLTNLISYFGFLNESSK